MKQEGSERSSHTTSFIVEANPECGVRLDAALVAEPFRVEIRQRVQALKEHGIGRCFLLPGCIILRQ
jgi:hypothetical protein